MKRSVGIGLSTAIIAPVVLTAAVSWGAASDTGCWDEYNNRGTRMYRTITPKDLDLADCTPAASCKWGYAARDGRRNRLYVPHGQDPATACEDIATTTTLPPVVTTAPPAPSTTEPGPGTTVPAPGGRFGLLPVGAELPSEATCASQVRPMTENRPENAAANSTRGTRADSLYPRVTGNFTGTTDEIIQWTACKWGIDEDWVRAQVVNESNWNQSALGDFSSDAAHCHPGNPIGNYPPQYNGDHEHVNECPESFGLGQVRYQFHDTAFVDDNAIESSAYNLDYTYAVWRTCFEGGYGWLNDPSLPGRGDYAAGDAEGCFGVWFSGRWYTNDAIGYIDRFRDTLANRTWEQSWFPAAQAAGGSSTTLPTIVTIPPATTAPATTVPATTAPATTVPAPTTTHAPAPTTTAPPATTVPPTPAPGGGFFEDFSGNSGLERFKTGVFHRDDFLVATNSWTGDHDESCGSPDSQRTITRSRPNDSFYMCRDHLMTAIGDTSGYSIAWFSPNQTFRADEVSQVSWDVNVTNLGHRQWWEVSIVSPEEPFLATVDWVASTANIDAYGSKSVVVGKGPFGNDGNIMTNGESHDPLGWGQICDYDPEGCASKAIRRTFTITDNKNGTLTFDFLGQRYTYAGSFPDQFQVYFKDHNYTPDKDGVPVGHTWHWDNIRVG